LNYHPSSQEIVIKWGIYVRINKFS
jgi:hypothetical protein